MLFKNITILDEELSVKKGMYIGIKGDKIDYIGTEMPRGDYGEMFDGKGKLLMSGFFNAHAHSPMMLMRGYGENMRLQDWLNDKIFPFEEKLTGNDVYWGTTLAMAESLRFGIVSSTDMYYFCEDMVQAVMDAGAKNNISRGIANFTGQDLMEMKAFHETKALYETYHNVGNGRIKIDMSIHAEYTSDPNTVKTLAQYAKDQCAQMHIHLSETKLEHDECGARHGKTPAQYFNDLGAFDTKTTAAHCVWISEEDADILAQKGVTVATCPVSNMKLASGICNVPMLLRKGVNVALGTDSVSSNNSLNFIEEIKFLAAGAKVRDQDPTAITPKEAIHIATRAGAKGQGRMNCGQIKEGYKADLIVLDIHKPHMLPVHDMLTNIVYSASGSDVELTMVDGRVLYRDGEYKTIDIEKTIFEVSKSTNQILAQLK